MCQIAYSAALSVKYQQCLNTEYSTDCPTVAHGEVAELLCQGPNHRGRLDGHGVVHPWRQDCSLSKTNTSVSSCHQDNCQTDRM